MTDRANFLVEIGTEELPPKALHRLELAFAEGISTRLKAAQLSGAALTSYASPRRLAVLIEAMPLAQPTQKIEKRGPPTRVAFDVDGNPTKAAIAFAAGFGIAVEALEHVVTEKGEWLEFRGEEPGSPATAMLPDIVAAALADLPIPKRMRWGSSEVEFVRPVHWVVMLLGNDVIEATLLGLTAGRTTRGHRFHAPGEIVIDAPETYCAQLKTQGRVLADFGTRRERVRALVGEAATGIGGTAHLEADVLDEVTALVEWPVPVTGRFDESFLRLPDEILVSTLQAHQRYFPVRDEDGNLMASFIAISNLDSTHPEVVQAGNERVILPRLADAAFFWDQDRRTSLDSRRDALRQVVFQKELGSLHDKSERVAALARTLAEELDEDATTAVRAAELAKTDLLTDMVGEFPDLQGRIGYYYAGLDGEPAAVAQAIEEQYFPVGAGSRLPKTPTGRIIALADRLDSITGIFAVGKRPTGNKDPFALRRAALGVLRILIEDGIDIDLTAYIQQAVNAQPVSAENPDGLCADIYAFVIDRLRGLILDGQAPGLDAGSVSPEVFEAVRARAPGSPLDFVQRVAAVRDFMQHDAADSLAAANKRIANILKSAEGDGDMQINADLLQEAAEQTLFSALQELTPAHAASLKERNYEEALTRLATLRGAVDAFFDGVMVMDKDAQLQRNRIALLTELRQRFLDVADLSCIPSA